MKSCLGIYQICLFMTPRSEIMVSSMPLSNQLLSSRNIPCIVKALTGVSNFLTEIEFLLSSEIVVWSRRDFFFFVTFEEKEPFQFFLMGQLFWRKNLSITVTEFCQRMFIGGVDRRCLFFWRVPLRIHCIDWRLGQLGSKGSLVWQEISPNTFCSTLAQAFACICLHLRDPLLA